MGERGKARETLLEANRHWLVIGAVVALAALVFYVSSQPAPKQQWATITPEEVEANRIADLKANPHGALRLELTGWKKGGFGSVYMLSGTVENTAEFAIKDPMISCTLYGASGTELGEVEETLYQMIGAGQTVRFRDLNMGFMGSTQVATSSCVLKLAALG